MKPTERATLLRTLERRFAQHPERHAAIAWDTVLARLERSPEACETLGRMEATGGEPDVVGMDGDQMLFCDCSAESPGVRRSLCFDREALDTRKENKPAGSAMEMAAQIGITLLTEAQYRALQQLGEFDLKTSSWIATPLAVRKLGGALFCDRRYGQVFTYHNGAQSYYAARGFRGVLRV